MRIFYDGFVYQEQQTGGVNRYFANIIKRLPGDWLPFLTISQSHPLELPAHPNLRISKFYRSRPMRVSYRVEKYYFRYITAATRFDLAHPTYYSLLTRQELSTYRCPVVLTVWDMIHELFPKEMDPAGQHAEEKRKALSAAQVIICISENTKKDLLERYPLLESKVRVTHLASEIDAALSHGPEPVPARPYYLYVGGRRGYKNFNTLLLAFAKFAPSRPDAALCVVGTPFNEAEKKVLNELKLADYVEHYSHPTDAHLAKLYRCSLALVYPSRYEGFGIPLLEAMACHTAVVASNTSSIPEVVGDAGLLFDPSDIDGLADILLFLIDDETERKRLIDKGSQRVREFSWDKTVADTITVYHSVSD